MSFKAAYCLECKTVIAAGGGLKEHRTIKVGGKEKLIPTLPKHRVGSKVHTKVALVDLPQRSIPPGAGLSTFLSGLIKECQEKIG